MNKLLPVAAALVSLCAAPAIAACSGPGTPMFHCTFKGGTKEVRVCLQGEVVLYSYGDRGRTPELVMGRREIGVNMTPWSGVGRSIWEEITFYNGTYSYILSYAIDRQIEGAPVEGRLIVADGDSEVAELVCDTGSVTAHDFYPLFEAKEAAGQRYCRDTFSWGSGC
ncbi:MAG: hypothetical protein AAF891_03790 [Pseudomonadota bacterium]